MNRQVGFIAYQNPRLARELGEEKKAESLAKDVEKANSKAGKQAL